MVTEKNMNIRKEGELTTASVERLTGSGAKDFSDFFAKTLRNLDIKDKDGKLIDSVYLEEEIEESIALRDPASVQEKIDNQEKWVLLTARVDGSVAGILEVQIITNPSNNEKMGLVKWVLTDPKFRRQGIARKLNAQLDELLRGRYACAGVIAGIKDKNITSIVVHEKSGFVRADDMQAKDGMHWYIKDFR